jgi:hypothetical protein
MSIRTFACIALAAALVVIATTVTAHAVRPSVQSSRVTFTELTRVCGQFLMGTYIVVHDDAKMAAGGPCTTFYRVADKPGVDADAVVSFHCIPRQRTAVSQTTITTVPTIGVTSATRSVDLVEYQIAGDSEAHGVPTSAEHLSNR